MKAFPTYHSLGDHTETLQLEYDPQKTSYRELLKLFWTNHDSTACHKRQYMSAIFFHNDEQKKLAEETRDEHQARVKRTIATKILPASVFYDAEDYHQKYLLRQNPSLLNSLGLNGEELKKSHAAARINGYVGGYSSFEMFSAEKLDLSEEQVNMVSKILGSKRIISNC